MKVANVEIKVETFNSTVKTKFEEVRGWDTYSVQGAFLIFHNAGATGEDIAYNQNDVAGITTYTE